MVWYKNLYVGRMIAGRKDRVIDEIDRGNYPNGVYLVLVPENENSQLEIIAAKELRHDWVRKHCRMIVGLALGKTEAQSMVETLAGDAYSSRGDGNIRAFLSEEQG